MSFSDLLQCSGRWTGTNQMLLGPNEPSDDSPSTLGVTPVLNRTFVRIDQRWDYQGTLQEGSVLIGCEDAKNRVTVHWIDTFLNGRRVMACEGDEGENNTIDVIGTYPSPGGPDWKWRVQIYAVASSTLEIVMFNISPDGHEDFAVRSSFVPASIDSLQS